MGVVKILDLQTEGKVLLKHAMDDTPQNEWPARIEAVHIDGILQDSRGCRIPSLAGRKK